LRGHVLSEPGRSRVSVALALSALVSAACMAPVEESTAAELRAPIVYGEASDLTEDYVMRLESKPAGSAGENCTATLVAPNVVFTALHCVSYFGAGIFSCDPDGTLVPTKPGDGEIRSLAPAESVKVFVGPDTKTEPDAYGIKVFGTGASNICRNDFAIVILDRNLDLPVASLRLVRPMARGELMTVVGYGLTEDKMSHGRRRRSRVPVTDVGPLVLSGPTTAAPRTFVLSQGACFGDSGGPALSEDTGALSGVYSLAGGQDCIARNVRNVYTRLSPFAKLIEQAFAEAGAEPVFEPYDGPPEQIDDPDAEPEPREPDAFGGSGSRSEGCATAPGRRRGSAVVGLVFALIAVAQLRRRPSR
jgi:hypothetical protein